MAFEIKCRGSCRSSRGRSGHHLVCRSGGEPPGPWRERACGDPRRVHPRPGGVAAQRRLRVGRTSALHPRVCGEAEGTHEETVSIEGPSPLVRGLFPAPGATSGTTQVHPRRAGCRVRRLPLDLVVGFIPARAGAALSLAGYGLRLEVHPRARGAGRDGLDPPRAVSTLELGRTGGDAGLGALDDDARTRGASAAAIRGRGALGRADPTKTPLVPDTTRCGPRRPGPRPSRRE